MSDEEFPGFLGTPNMNIFLFKAKTQFELFSEARERYHEVVEKLMNVLKDMPLQILIELAEYTSNTSKYTDPDTFSDQKLSLGEAARREIHRRAFQEFTIVPFKKEKLNSYDLGFLRKPKF